MEGGSDGTWTGVEFLHVPFDLSAEACLVEIDTEDILAGVELLEAAPVLIGLADLQGSDDGLQLCQHGIGRGLEGCAVVGRNQRG